MSTYLQLCNIVLRELNEEVITTVTGNTVVQAFVVDKVKQAINEIQSDQLEWKFNYTSATQALTAGKAVYNLPSDAKSLDLDTFLLRPTDLITNGDFTSNITSWTDNSAGTGTIAYTSDGDGRMRFTGVDSSNYGAAEQAISVITGQTFRIHFRIFTSSIKLQIGTTSTGSEILSATSYSVTNTGDGAWHTVDFTPTASTVYIQFIKNDNATTDLDRVICRQNIAARSLVFTDYEFFHEKYRSSDFDDIPSAWGTPEKVFITQTSTFGLTPTPKSNKWEVAFDYWALPTEVSADASTTTIPTRWEWLIIERALMYGWRFLRDFEAAKIAADVYKDGMKQLRIEQINRERMMRPKYVVI